MRRKVRNDAELARNSQKYLQKIAGLGQNHEICCIAYLLGISMSRAVQITYIHCTGSWKALREKCIENVRYSAENNIKTREIADFAENRGFGPKSQNLLHPWNRDFLEGQPMAV